MNKKNNKTKTDLAVSDIITSSGPSITKNYRHSHRAHNLLAVRAYTGANFDFSTTDLLPSPSLQQDLKVSLKKLRDFGRTFSLESEYGRRYLEIIKSQIIGASGIKLSVTAFDEKSGLIDQDSPKATAHFEKWCKNISCGKAMSIAKAQSLILEYMARDGEALAIIRRGPNYGPYNIQIQVLDPEHLDDNYNQMLQNGNNVVQGVEINKHGKPVAYHILTNNPSDTFSAAGDRVRFDAKDVIHMFDMERTSQTRGYSWFANVIRSLHQITEYRQTVLLQARLNAANSRYLKPTSSNPAPLIGGFVAPEALENTGDLTPEEQEKAEYDALLKYGDFVKKVIPGAIEILPEGWEVENLEWKNGSQSLQDFQKAVLRGVASGLGVSYGTLSNDTADVNYSTSRFIALVDNEFYKGIQQIIADEFVQRLYEEWLDVQLLTNYWKLNIPAYRFEKFSQTRLTPPKFGTIDPKLDAEADILEFENNLVSLSEIAEKRGRSLEAVLIQRQQDEKLLAKYGITKESAVQAITKK